MSLSLYLIAPCGHLNLQPVHIYIAVVALMRFHMFIVPPPSTIIVALESPKPSLKHSTNDWLFSDVILLIVRLAGLANVVVSGEVTWGNKSATPLLAADLALPLGTFKSTFQNIPPLSGKLLLQVNVTFPPSGTTYPPGAGSASADRVTIYRRDRLSESSCVQNVL